MIQSMAPWGSVPSAHGTPTAVVDDGVHVSVHALDRLREHHRDADRAQILGLLARATELAPETTQQVLGFRRLATSHRFFVAQDARGAFVVGRNDRCPCPWVVKTYLRFDARQRRIAVSLVAQRWQPSVSVAAAPSAESRSERGESRPASAAAVGAGPASGGRR